MATETVLSEIGLFVSSRCNFNTSILDHNKELKNNAFFGRGLQIQHHDGVDEKVSKFPILHPVRSSPSLLRIQFLKMSSVRVSDELHDHNSIIGSNTFTSACMATGIFASNSCFADRFRVEFTMWLRRTVWSRGGSSDSVVIEW